MPQSDQSPHVVSQTLQNACHKALELIATSHFDLAEQLYRAVLQADPRHAAANHGLGTLHVLAKRPTDALPYLRAAVEASPTIADHWASYLDALTLAGNTEEAKSILALARQQGIASDAIEACAKHLESQTQTHTAEAPLPAVQPRAERRRKARLERQFETELLDMLKHGRFVEAMATARKMTMEFPQSGFAWKSLGALLWAEEKTDEGIAAMQTAVTLLPHDAEAHLNLATSLYKLDRFDQTETLLRTAMQIDPRQVESLGGSLLLFVLSHSTAVEPRTLFAEHRRIGELLEGHWRSSWPRHSNSKDPERQLKIGFVSGDFCNHSVTTFFEPVLAHLHKMPGLELYAYYNNDIDDYVTQRVRPYFAHWKNVLKVDDAKFVRNVMNDRIDILVDLSGHSMLNRLSAFARKPAPIQISWIGYPGTTGLKAMDYYLADRHYFPPGLLDDQFTEKLVFLPATAPFQPHPASPPVNELPALTAGRLTFGSFNRLGKISDSTIDVWAQLLQAVPDAQLLIAGIVSNTQINPLGDRLQATGISRDRVRFYLRGEMDAYLELHHQVDICLDTHPYTGGTTNYHALWMGVPTLTIAGSTPAGRQGAAMPGHLGLQGFVATDKADFAAKGVYWSTHLKELAAIRARIRNDWQQSENQQPEVIAAGLERALRHMWRRWCNGLQPESFHA